MAQDEIGFPVKMQAKKKARDRPLSGLVLLEDDFYYRTVNVALNLLSPFTGLNSTV